MKEDVTFTSNGLKIAGHLYLPDDIKPGERRPAIVAVHPFTSIKEQSPSHYAPGLAKAGCIVLTYDAA